MSDGTERPEENAENVRSSSRERVATEKGLAYQIELLQGNVDSALKSWKRQIGTTKGALAFSTDITPLQRERYKLEARMDDLTNVYRKLIDVLDSEESKSNATENNETYRRETEEICRSVNERISQLQYEKREQREERESVFSKRSDRSRNSRKSRKKSHYSSSSLLGKAEMLAKAARLGAELKFHDIESEKVAALKRQESDVKKLQMIKELAATTAEIEAVARIEEEDYEGDLPEEEEDPYGRINEYLQSQLNTVIDGNSSAEAATNLENVVTTVSSEINAQTNLTFSSTPRVATDSQKPPAKLRSPVAPPFTVKPTTTTPLAFIHSDSPTRSVNPPKATGDDNVITKLADVLTQRQDRDSLPRPEPEVFKGDLLRYPMWIKSFETFIERKTKDPSERLYYLSKFTADEAKEAVGGLLPLDTKEAYIEAKKTLASRFGDPFLVSNAYRRKISEWPRILPKDGPGLRRFSDFLQHCYTAMHSIKYLEVLNDPEENQKMLRKLPNHLVSRWSRIVDKRIGEEREEDQSREDSGVPEGNAREAKYPPFEEFCRFLKTEARIACNPITSLQTTKEEEDSKGTGDKWRSGGKFPRNKDTGVNSFATGGNEVKEGNVRGREENKSKRTVCLYCKATHDMDACDKFIHLPLAERRNFVQAKCLCWGCLKWGHVNKDCRGKKACKTCNGPHPTCLHDETWKSPHKPEPPNQDTTVYTGPNQDTHVSHCIEVRSTKALDHGTSHSLIVPVWLHHQDNPDSKVKVYALLDEQSDACFVKESTLNAIGVDGPDVQLELSTVLGQKTITSKRVTGLTVRGVSETSEIILPKTYTRDVIPARRSQIPRRDTALKWPHLESITGHLMPLDTGAEIGLLIGANCPRAIKPHEVILGNDDDPYAKRTALGWGIIGETDPQGQDNSTGDVKSDVFCNRIVAYEIQKEIQAMSIKKVCHFALKTQVKEVLSPLQISKMFTLDFNERATEEKSLSFEDRMFLTIVQEGIHQRDDGHYEMPLPLKNNNVELPNNKELALSRLMKLKQRLKSDTQYRKDYVDFMQENIKNGLAEKVPKEEVSDKNKRVWYIPHHGVYHKKKPGKIRVVFDCSVSHHGFSLNQQLLQGPDLTNNLTGVLCRFRRERIAFMCDIQAMFHQLKVDGIHRDYLRFLWWDDENFDSDPVEYRMTVHLFGATSSPGCANFALKTTANQYEGVCGKEAADFVRKDFYVDDGLKSVALVDQAKSLISSTKSLCQKGGFRLHKFVSNSTEVLNSVPPEDRATDKKDLSIVSNDPEIERALGVHWCTESDTLQFRIELKDKPLSRRGILSTVSSIYDPLGLVAPVILQGKRILQELCRDGVRWDDEVPEDIRPRWERWRAELPALEKLKVLRCHKLNEFGEIKKVELHHFSDASQNGYGQCSYLRLTDDNDRIHCSLVMGKSRVTPLKPVTIPRLELTAAVVASKIGCVLRKELEYEEVKETYWTDSKTVLGYINNDARRFHVFVGNRVQEIRDKTSPDQWNYIGTKDNPADLPMSPLVAPVCKN